MTNIYIYIYIYICICIPYTVDQHNHSSRRVHSMLCSGNEIWLNCLGFLGNTRWPGYTIQQWRWNMKHINSTWFKPKQMGTDLGLHGTWLSRGTLLYDVLWLLSHLKVCQKFSYWCLVGNEGMREWSRITSNNHPGNPHSHPFPT